MIRRPWSDESLPWSPPGASRARPRSSPSRVGQDLIDDLATRNEADSADVVVDESGTPERHLPLRNAVEVKAAACFSRHRDAFRTAERRTLAR
jgi:hypothetical protein